MENLGSYHIFLRDHWQTFLEDIVLVHLSVAMFKIGAESKQKVAPSNYL